MPVIEVEFFGTFIVAVIYIFAIIYIFRDEVNTVKIGAPHPDIKIGAPHPDIKIGDIVYLKLEYIDAIVSRKKKDGSHPNFIKQISASRHARLKVVGNYDAQKVHLLCSDIPNWGFGQGCKLDGKFIGTWIIRREELTKEDPSGNTVSLFDLNKNLS